MTMILDGSNGLTMPTWTTTGRPTNPIIGAQGYNTTYGGVEVYNGSAWDLITGGPAFSAYMGAGQSLSNGSLTKVAFNTKQFDTNNNYDTTNYRFTPTVAGYYQINVSVYLGGMYANSWASIYKNGNEWQRGNQATQQNVNVSSLIYCNGSTDYIEAYAIQTSGSTQSIGAYSFMTFSGSMTRAA